MNISYYCNGWFKFRAIFIIMAAGIFLVPAIFVFAQSGESANGSGVTAALQDLSKVTGQEVTRVEQARAICNLEEHLTDCAEIGKRHNLFSAEEVKQVDTVLSELKGKIVDDLKACQDATCLIEVANQLARRLSSKDSALAKELDLTTAKVQEKKVIVDTAREVGVDINECRTMDPETAPVELLRSCVKLARDKRVEKYLPAEAKALGQRTDTTLDLQEALKKGDYQCGDNTLDGCGNYCLNPTGTARTGSTASIPMVCRQIAEKFFGEEGVGQLENAYTQTKGAAEYYQKRAAAVTFNTHDGRILTNPAEIGKYMEGEMQKGNVEAIERGMDFMVTRGFVKSEDKDFATGMAKKIREQGGEFNFDECAKNPDKCNNFVPEDHREEFGIMADIHRIITEEMRSRGVPDPSLCENNREYGEACVKGAQAALPKIQDIAKKFPQAKFIVDEIQQKISFGDKGFEARRRVEDEFRKGSGEFKIGDRVFRNFEEMDVFCKENGSICLTETVKKGLIGKDYAKDRYEHSYEVNFGQPGGPFPSGEFSRQGPFPGFVPPGAGGELPPGKIPGFTAPGPGFGGPPGFNKEEALKQFQAWLDNPVGAPPIPSTGYPGGPGSYPGGSPYPSDGQYRPGDYRRGGDPSHTSPTFCPVTYALRSCPDGQYHPESFDQRGCPVYGECIPVSKSLPIERTICPLRPTVNSCPPDQDRVLAFSSPECGEYYDCVPRGGGITSPQCSDGRDNDNDGQVDYPRDNGCYSSYDDDEAVGAPSTPPTPGSIQCSDGRDNDNDGRIDYPADPSCYGPDDNDEWYPQYSEPQPTGCRNYSTQDSCQTSSCVWYINHYDGNHCDDSLHGQFNGTKCPTGQYWNGNVCIGEGTTPPPYPSPGTCGKELLNLLGDGCHSMGNAYFDGQMTKYVYPGSNTVTSCTASYIQNCSVGSGPQPPPGTPVKCSDGIDNDGDGQIDYPADTGCYSRDDNDEYGGYTPIQVPPPPGTPAQCSDGRDNDNDSKIDYPADSSCYGPDDNDEYYPTSTTGGGTCPSFAHEMGGYCMLNNDTSRCAEYPNSSTEANYNNTVCQQRSGTTPTPPPGSGCGSQTSPASCGTQQGCSWYYPPSGGAGWCQSSTTTTCPSGQYWYVPSGGGAGYCKTTSPTDCPSGQYWNGTSCISSTTPPPSPTPGGVQCSDGIDNDGDGKVDYPADPDCYDASTDTSENCCYSPSVVGSCPSQTSQSSCQSAGCTWYVSHYDGTHCDDTAHGQSTSPPTSQGSCPSGYHYMSNSLTVGATTYNGYCMSDSNSSNCQPVNGGASFSCSGSTTTSPPSSTACNSNGVCEYGESTGSCPSDCGSYTSPPPSTTTCSSGQYWNGTSCVTDTHNCASGQYWNGTACVTSTTPPPSTSTGTCSSGQYWDGAACVTSTTPPPTTPPPSTSTGTCSSGQYWDGAACVTSTTPPPTTPPPTSPPPSPPPTSYLRHCPTSHDWNGSYCVARRQSTAHLFAQVNTTFRNVSRSIAELFGW